MELQEEQLFANANSFFGGTDPASEPGLERSPDPAILVVSRSLQPADQVGKAIVSANHGHVSVVVSVDVFTKASQIGTALYLRMHIYILGGFLRVLFFIFSKTYRETRFSNYIALGRV